MANTFPEVKFKKQVLGGAGVNADVSAVCTTDEDTTACINKQGLSHGDIFNPGGDAVVITWYSSDSPTGTRRPHTDQDGVAVTQTVAAGGSQELHTAVAGCPWLLPVTGAAATLAIHFER